MELQIEAKDGRQYQLLPNPEVPEDLIVEDQTYLLRLGGFSGREDLAGCQLVLGDVAQGAGRYERADQLAWPWEVKDYAGRVTIGLERADRTPLWPTHEVIVDPNRAKLTREQFATMVEDISAEATIAYSLSPATQRTDLGRHRQTLGLAQLEYIRHQIKPLQRAVEAIARRPRRTLTSLDECVDLACAQAPDDRSLTWLLGRPQELTAVDRENVPPGAQDLHGQLRGHLPARLQVSRRTVSHDVYENQLIKHFLQRLSVVLRHTEARLREAEQNRALDEPIRRLAGRRREEIVRRRYHHVLYNLLSLDFLGEVSPLRQVKPVTQALRRDPLYARFYALYRQFDRAITPFDGDPFQLSMEKTWQLYEYWCFFQVIAALRRLAGGSLQFDARPLLCAHPDRISLALPGAQVEISPRIRVYFQKSYGYYGWRSGQSPTHVGTYSHEMRPDISIEVYDDQGHIDRIILLDPKYRVSDLSINQAMDDLHTYKDAIVAPDRRRLAETALVLCPSAEKAKPLYFQEDYIQTHGLGALVLRPGDAGVELLASRLERIIGFGQVGE